MMKQDNQLKELLKKHAVEQTADDFTIKTMQLINSLAINTNTSLSRKDALVKRLLVLLLSLITVVLVVLSTSLKPMQTPVEFSIELPAFLANHLYDFLILFPAFWLLIFINRKYEKRISM
jgi:uncharacterized membrane protein